MWTILISIFLIEYWKTVSTSTQSVAVIRNVSLVPFNTSSVIINGTCSECLCAVVMQTTSFTSLNCFSNNQTCQMFSEVLIIGSFALTNSTTSSFYFFSWPIEVTTMTTSVTTALSDVEYLWTFDSTYRDLSSIFDGIPINGIGFNSSTITGYGSSLSSSSATQQSVDMVNPFLNLNNRSWTFEAWIYPLTLSYFTHYGIIGQCESQSLDLCLHMNVRSQKLHLGFFANDVTGTVSLVTSKWYHAAFVFSSTTRNQSIYLNGILENSRTSTSVYRGSSGNLTVGSSLLSNTKCYFDGFIDQLCYTNRVKTSAEILDDATLTLYFSFDNGSLYDSGPLRINGSIVGSTNIVTGRVGNALQFGPSIGSYFHVNGLVLLGTSNQSYSMSVWIKPTIINSSTIIHVSLRSDGRGGWCLGMLGLSSSGQLIATSWANAEISVAGPISGVNSWTHAAITYSSSNGLRLYINGTLCNSTIPFEYSASGRPNYLFLGNHVNGTQCGGGGGIHGQFIGALDEFRLYSRELSASDISDLFQP